MAPGMRCRTDADLKAVRDAGYTDANVMEFVALVACTP